MRNLEIIGEAAKQIPDEYRKSNSEIDWKSIAGMRDRLSHHYFGFVFEIVWDVGKYDIPKWKKDIANLLEKESEN